MPLQSGATAFKTVAFSLLLFLFIWGIWPVIVIALMARDARKRRASDIVFDDDGFEIRGGAHQSGFAWKEIAKSTITVRETQELFVKAGNNPAQNIWRLAIDDDVILAESGDRDEIASFEVVARAIRSAQKTETGTLPPPPLSNAPIQAALCPQCGAPLVPADADQVLCAYCGNHCRMPLDVRNTLQLAAEADRALEDLGRNVSKALDSGHPNATNWSVFFFWLAGALAIPILVVTHSLGGALIAFALPLALAAVTSLLVAQRRAVRTLSVGCAAATSPDPAHAPMCRRCRAPLPPSANPARIIATCAYCQTQNILGLPFGFAEEAVSADEEIADVIRTRRTASINGSIALGLAAAMLVAGIALTLLR